MGASLLALPVRRPTATAMFFLGLILLGLFAWYRIPIELMPALSGEQLVVSFGRQGSEPEVVEREILMPLEARVGELAGLKETWGEINGASGRLQLEFERGTNYRVRELELRSIAAELNRSQPEGTFISVASQDLTVFSRFAMIVQVTGGDDADALRDFVDERIQPRLAAVPGVSQVQANGGAPREVTVWIDPERSAAYGIRPEQLNLLLSQSLQRLRYLGGVEQDGRRWQLILDGRPEGIASLGEIRIDPERPVLLRHIADIEMGTARAESAFRINGADATGLIVFQEEGANLVRLGRDLRARIGALRTEFNPYGIDFDIGFDAAETVEDQLSRLRNLAIWGFVIALIVLYLFLRELRAVAVVAVAVPVSLLTAGAMLYLGGYTLNLITLLGLVVGIGMLVDNSVVVFEAVQRRLEHGLEPQAAAIGGVERTVRAIVAASATNAIVFLPALFLVEDSFIRGALELISVAILLPLAASLLVAIGLVPLLAARLAAPAARARLEREARRRREQGAPGSRAPDRTRALLSGLLKSALRRPAGWIVGVTVAIVLTIMIALPWVLVGSLGQQAEQTEQVTLQIELDGGASLEAAVAVFERIEQSVLALDGIERVESSIEELGGSVTVHLDPAARDSGGATPARVRAEARRAVNGLSHVEISTADMGDAAGGGGGGGGGGGSGGLLGETSSDVLVSGPDMARLHALADEIRARLESISEVENAVISGRVGQDEVRIEPLRAALTAYRLHPEQVLEVLNVFRREGLELQVGFTLPDGRELPLTVRRPESEDLRALQSIFEMRLATEQGAMPLGAVTTGRTLPPAPAIAHHNGRRELAISYSLSDTAPETGPDRVRLEESIKNAVRDAYRPPGYTVEAVGAEESTNWFRLLFIPILLLLYAVLAITFESLTMPVLVLVAVPLTILGGTWALVLAQAGAGVYALVGVIALLGLTVNPAILLVDRMQRRLLETGCSAGSAAMAAVRERTRPVFMTSCTTIAGLWPLALSTGEEFEIWPPFATVVMGGLATSTVLTLLLIPVGYVMLARIDRIFGRLGPWILLGWIAATAAVIAPLVVTEQLVSLNWQIVTTVLVAAAFLALALAVFRRPPRLEFDPDATAIEARYLGKTYGRPGPVKQAWLSGRSASTRTRAEALERAPVFALLLAAMLYLAINLGSIWKLVSAYLAAAFAAHLVIELGYALWPADASAAASRLRRRARFASALLTASPWLMLASFWVYGTLLPRLREEVDRVPPAAYVLLGLGTLIVQLGRLSARRASMEGVDDVGRIRAMFRKLSLIVFGFDLPREEVEALATTSLAARQGMVGILGPNGAGKSTLLRMLAGVLDPSSGAIHYSGRLKRRLGHYVSRWVGYLPQEFGLPEHLSAEEYLDYFALLYQVGDRQERRRRVDELLTEVGLFERRRDRIGGYSGGMRQRVAVARTLLRQPPIIIVDEPTVGLDPRERIRFRNLLSRLAQGRVVLFSTHVVEDVAVSCERVIVFNGGRIVYDGKPAELAEVANGLVWEIRQAAGRTVELPAACKVVDEVPDAGGGVRLRVLSAAAPHPLAQRVQPLIEDGYLQLVK